MEVSPKHLETAIHIAVNMFYGVTERSGMPYIFRPLRVMNMLDTPEEKTVAILHYVVDDSFSIADDIRNRGIPQSCIDTALLLYQYCDSYEEYIQKIAKDPVARKVKLADLMDKCDLSRLKFMSEKDGSRLPEYLRAIMFLESQK